MTRNFNPRLEHEREEIYDRAMRRMKGVRAGVIFYAIPTLFPIPMVIWILVEFAHHNFRDLLHQIPILVMGLGLIIGSPFAFLNDTAFNRGDFTND